MVWLVVCSGAACLALLGLLSVERLRSPVEIESTYVALVVGQAFFLVFLWPLFEYRSPPGPRVESVCGAGARLVGLLFLSTPLIVLSLRTSEAALTVVLRSQALVLLVGLTAGAAVRLPGFVLWYYPSAFFASAVVPFAAYLLSEEGGVSVGWAAVISPLWAAGAAASGEPSSAALVLFACLGCSAVVAVFLFRRRAARAVDADQP